MNRWNQLVLVAGCALGAWTSNTQAATIGYWRFEEGTSGASISTAVSQVNSLTASPYTGSQSVAPKFSDQVVGSTIVDPLTSTTYTNTGSMLAPAQATNNKSYIYVPDTVGNILDQSSFTVEMFVRIDNSSPLTLNTALAERIPSSPPERWQLRVSPGTGHLAYRSDPLGGPTNQTATGTKKIDDGLWHHVAMTYDQTTQTLKTYVDYQLDLSKTQVVTNVNNAPINFGRMASGADGVYNWYFDEVRYSSGVLTSSQFLQLPEPASLGLLGAGVLSLGLRRQAR